MRLYWRAAWYDGNSYYEWFNLYALIKLSIMYKTVTVLLSLGLISILQTLQAYFLLFTSELLLILSLFHFHFLSDFRSVSHFSCRTLPLSCFVRSLIVDTALALSHIKINSIHDQEFHNSYVFVFVSMIWILNRFQLCDSLIPHAKTTHFRYGYDNGIGSKIWATFIQIIWFIFPILSLPLDIKG